MKLKNRILLVLLFLFFISCVTTQIPLPEEATLLHSVPFFRQDDFQCGPAAFATVVNYWYMKRETDKNLRLEEIIPEIYSASARGVLGIDLELYAKRLGFHALQYKGSIEDLKNNINRGIPLIMLVDYGISVYQRNHFIVATGYTKNDIIVNSGRKQNELIHNEDLNKIWKKTGFWTLIIEP